jgi:cbb3-type cytochrome oxidase maturation protein
MSVLIVLILASISIAAIFLIAFLWAVRSGQFDDQVTPSIRILFDSKANNKKINNHEGI